MISRDVTPNHLLLVVYYAQITHQQESSFCISLSWPNKKHHESAGGAYTCIRNAIAKVAVMIPDIKMVDPRGRGKGRAFLGQLHTALVADAANESLS